MTDSTYGPRMRDWMLMIGSGAFVLAGLGMLLAGGDPSAAMASIVFFGLCFSVGAWLVLQKRQISAALLSDGRVSLPGATMISMSKRRPLVAGVTLLIGAMGSFSLSGFPPEFYWCTGAMGLAGAALAVATLLGKTATSTIAFTEEGVWFASPSLRWMAAWENIASVSLGEMNHNPVICIDLLDVQHAVHTAVPDTQPGREAVAQALNQHISWLNCHAMIMPGHYGLNAGTVLRGIEGYLAHPESRQELGTHPSEA